MRLSDLLHQKASVIRDVDSAATRAEDAAEAFNKELRKLYAKLSAAVDEYTEAVESADQWLEDVDNGIIDELGERSRARGIVKKCSIDETQEELPDLPTIELELSHGEELEDVPDDMKELAAADLSHRRPAT